MNDEIIQLFDRYVRCLDDGRHEEWLDLFVADGYYGIVTHRDFRLGTNQMIVGEKKHQLADRVHTGAPLDRDRKLHLLTAITTTGNWATPSEPIHPDAIANFALFRNAMPVYCGRYLAWFRGSGSDLKIRKWLVVLDNETIAQPVVLPI